MQRNPIRTIAIIGGGIVGWSAAAALRRKLPAVDVAVLPLEPPSDSLADRIGCTLPSIVDFHEDIGLTEADTVVRAGSSFRLGTRFEQWVEGGEDYVHAYGPYGDSLGATGFHQHWMRAMRSGKAAPFEAHSAAAVAASHGRFVHPEAAPQSPFASMGYGLHIEPRRYREMMRAYALHLGARERAGSISSVRLREADGFVEAVDLDGGGALAADLFIDASGPRALVRSALDDRWEDWSRWFPADRMMLAESAAPGELPVLDRVVALQSGWRWEAAGLARTSHGLVYSSAHLSDSKAERLLRNAASAEPEDKAVVLRPGRRPEPWLRNCVAIGDAAVAVEPLEWTNLHLAHSAIDRIVAMMPDRDCSHIELWDYNRQIAAEADRVRDFLLAHYVAANRPGDQFWTDASKRELPPSLAHTLTQFRERGRLPFYEEETFSRDSWLAMLLGQQLFPRRVDPLIDVVPEQESDAAMTRIRNAIANAVEQLPAHSDYLRTLARRASR